MYDVQFEKKITKAIEAGNLEEVEELLGNDAERLNMAIPRGNWLNIAVAYQKIEIVKYLLESGIEKNIMTENGNSLVNAARTGNVELIQYLLQSGVELVSTLDKTNPIFATVQADRLGAFQYLLELEKRMMIKKEFDELMKLLRERAEIFSCKKILKYLKIEKIEQQKEIQQEQKDKIVQMIKINVRECFEEIKNNYAKQKIYILSLECDENLSNIYIYINTDEHLRQKLEEADEDMKDEIYYYKYCENEWYIFDENPECFACVGKYIMDEGINNEDKSIWYELIVESVFELRKEKFFERIGLDEILITIYAHDIYSKEEFVKLFEKMNQGKEVGEFINNMHDFY